MFNKNKRMPVWGLVVTDILLLLISMGVFMLFDYILPRENSKKATVVTDEESDSLTDFNMPNTSEYSNTQGDESNSSDNSTTVGVGDGLKNHTSIHATGNTGTSQFYSDSLTLDFLTIKEEVVKTYKNDNEDLTITKKELGTGNDKITYYVADIYVSNIKYLKTAFAKGKYGKNIKESVLDQAKDNNAIFAVSGDFYGNTEEGVVIRNGKLYRSEINDADTCIIYANGTMETYTSDEYDSDAVIKKGVWQGFTFGPGLLEDGKVKKVFNTTNYLNSRNPRCSIGYVEPGHYIITVVDGRDEGYSRGATLTELAEIMANEGCTVAYNLDGGKSASMVFDGEYVNKPCDGGRAVSDIVYIGA